MHLKISVSWSGGKDSCYALMRAIEVGAKPIILLNMMHETHNVSRSHGLPIELLTQQAEAIQIPLLAVPASWEGYQAAFISALKEIKSSRSIEAMVFGDIDLQAHRDWEEMVCDQVGIRAMLPLWHEERIALVGQMLADGIEAMIVSCNTAMGERFLGRMLTPELVPELESLGVDPCGENGEFHTLVVNCPLFTRPLVLPRYNNVQRGEYWFVEWIC